MAKRYLFVKLRLGLSIGNLGLGLDSNGKSFTNYRLNVTLDTRTREFQYKMLAR